MLPTPSNTRVHMRHTHTDSYFQHCFHGQCCTFLHICSDSRGTTPNMPGPLTPSPHMTYICHYDQVFVRFLAHHPEQAFAPKLIQYLTFSFDIGYFGPHIPLLAKNLNLAFEHPLQKEVANYRMAGPYPTPPYPNLHYSGLRVVPKKDRSWIFINHLSAPAGDSINNYVHRPLRIHFRILHH